MLGLRPLGVVQMILLFDPTSRTSALSARATVIALFDPNTSSFLQSPLMVKILLLPAISA
jgi:hypothetical protein